MKRSKIKTIFLAVIASVTLRDIVKNGVIGEIKRQEPGCRIVVLTPLPLTKGFLKLFEGTGVVFEKTPFVSFEEHQKFFSLKRLRSFVFALSNPGLKTTRIMVGTFKEGTYGEKMPVVYYLFKAMDFLNPPFVSRFYAWLRNVLMRLEIRISRKEDAPYQELFDKYKPSLVVCHAPYARSQIPLQRTSIRNRMRLIGIINSWDNITSSGELSMKMDKLIVWSKLMKNEAIKFLKYKPSEIEIAGALQFDHYFKAKGLRNREQFARHFGLNPSKKIIAYTVSSELLFPNEHKIVELLSRTLKSDKRLSDYQLLVRLYPPNEKLMPYREMEKKGIAVHYTGNVRLGEERFMPDDSFLKDLIETMKYSDIIVNYPSTIILDAAMFCKPVVNIKFDLPPEKKFYKSSIRFYDYNHIKYVLDSGATIIAKSPAELKQALLNLAENPSLKERQIKDFQEKVCGTVDGKSYNRVAKIISNSL